MQYLHESAKCVTDHETLAYTTMIPPLPLYMKCSILLLILLITILNFSLSKITVTQLLFTVITFVSTIHFNSEAMHGCVLRNYTDYSCHIATVVSKVLATSDFKWKLHNQVNTSQNKLIFLYLKIQALQILYPTLLTQC